jgi:hypothetical protein
MNRELDHCLGLLDGQMQCWGLNANGELGLGYMHGSTVRLTALEQTKLGLRGEVEDRGQSEDFCL